VDEVAAFLPYVPAHVREHLARDPGADPTAEVTRERAVVLFADISGFTPITEALATKGADGAEELTLILNRFFGHLIDTIEALGGDVAAFAGDAVTALFPGDDAVAAERAVSAATAVQAMTQTLGTVETSVGVFDLACKIGIGVGDVVETSGGVFGDRLTPIVIGDPLNVAAEAEHRAGPGDIVVDPSITSLLPAIGWRADPDGFSWIEDATSRELSLAGTDRAPAQPRAEAAGTLASFLHPAIAARIRAGHRRFIGEHRRVTLLFIGLPGPGAIQELCDYVHRLTETIVGFEGHLLHVDAGDKGLKAIALFGAPIAHGDDETRALRCALTIQGLPSRGGVSVGAATGVTFCGEVGGLQRATYTAIGDTVNVAARLMQAAKPGQILLAGPLPEDRATLLEVEPLEPLQVKGRNAPVTPLELRGVRKGIGPLGERVYHHALVGRDEELATADAWIGRALDGTGGVLAILGEAGSGKSRLAAEVAAHAAAIGLRVHLGANPSYGATEPYLPWRTIVGSALGPLGTETRSAVDAVSAIDPALAGRAPLLSPVLDIAIEDSDVTEGLLPQLRDELLPSFLVDLITGGGPALIVLEDVHQMDAASWDVLEAFARTSGSKPLLVLVTARTAPGAADPIARLGDVVEVTTVALGRLDDDAVRSFVQERTKALFGRRRVPPALVDLAVARSGGNPFFLEELLYLIRDRGVDPSDSAALRALESPGSVSSLVLARIDALPEREQTTLKVASVLGRRFRADWLWGATPALGTPDEVRASLDRLEHLQMIAPIDPDEYLFRHAILRDAAYGSLSVGLRRELHGDLGRFLEHTHEEDLVPVVQALAFHFGETDDVARQLRYFRMAADTARAAFANETALQWLERLQPILSGADEVAVRLDQGDIRRLMGDWAGAESDYRRAFESQQPMLATRAARELGYLLSQQGQLHEGRALLERALVDAEGAGDDAGVRKTLEYLAFAAHDQTDFDASLGYSTRLLEAAEKAGDLSSLSMAWEQTGMVHLHRAAHAEALAAFERALAIAEFGDDRRGLIHACNDLAGLLVEMEDLAGAARYVRQALETSREIGYRHPEGVLVGNAGELFRLSGDPAQAIACATVGMEITADLGDRVDVTAKLINLSRALVDLNRLVDALAFARLAISLSQANDDAFMYPEALLQLAEIEAWREEFEQAHEAIGDVLATAALAGREDLVARARELQETLARERLTSSEAPPPSPASSPVLDPLVVDDVTLDARIAQALAKGLEVLQAATRSTVRS
jgi:class 3 adenylate cyclase/tetratricopeptide (TPR) repeat protein